MFFGTFSLRQQASGPSFGFDGRHQVHLGDEQPQQAPSSVAAAKTAAMIKYMRVVQQMCQERQELQKNQLNKSRPE